MKARSLVFFALSAGIVVAGACSRSDSSAASAAAASSGAQARSGAAALAEATFKVSGMHCATCPLTVRTAAKSVAGVTDARANMEEANVRVTYDPSRTDPTKIAAAISDAGYPATQVP